MQTPELGVEELRLLKLNTCGKASTPDEFIFIQPAYLGAIFFWGQELGVDGRVS